MVFPRARVVADFRDRFDCEPVLLVRAPGRVNLLGGQVATIAREGVYDD
jgi:galactokinase